MELQVLMVFKGEHVHRRMSPTLEIKSNQLSNIQVTCNFAQGLSILWVAFQHHILLAGLVTKNAFENRVTRKLRRNELIIVAALFYDEMLMRILCDLVSYLGL